MKARDCSLTVRAAQLQWLRESGWSTGLIGRIGGVNRTTAAAWITGRLPIPYDVAGRFFDTFTMFFFPEAANSHEGTRRAYEMFRNLPAGGHRVAV